MPSAITSEFLDHLSGEVLTLCACLKIVRVDGVIFGFTNHTEDLLIDSVIYRSGSGMTPSAVQSTTGPQIDNGEIKWIFNDNQISEHDILCNFFDNASVYAFIANYEDLSMGFIKGPKFRLGKADMSDDGVCTIQTRSLTQLAAQRVTESTRMTCRAKLLGDIRCKFNLDGLTNDGYVTTHNGWVTDVSSAREFTSNLNNTYDTPSSLSELYTWTTVTWGRSVSNNENFDYRELPIDSFDGNRFLLAVNPNLVDDLKVGDTGVVHSIRISDSASVDWDLVVIAVRQESNGAWSVQCQSNFFGTIPSHTAGSLPTNFFQNGILTWTTGENQNVSMEVMSFDSLSFVLQEQMPFSIHNGDTFVVTVGCDRTVGMCHDRFNNVINFVGEPGIKPYSKVVEIQSAN